MLLLINLNKNKKCTKCKNLQTFSEFVKDKNVKDGISIWCKKCRNQSKKVWQIKNKEKCKIDKKKWEKENKEHIIEYDKKRFEENPEKVRKIARESARRQRAANPEKFASDGYKLRVRKSHLKRKFGITIEDYDNMLRSQMGLCAICGASQKDSTKLFAVDHCHKTGKIRGILCQLCNTGIGALKDSTEILDKALKYLTFFDKEE